MKSFYNKPSKSKIERLVQSYDHNQRAEAAELLSQHPEYVYYASFY